jgi:class 3 adenylate cyclase
MTTVPSVGSAPNAVPRSPSEWVSGVGWWGVAPAGERRQVTVLFCDLVGSTPLSQQLDAEEWREVIAQYQQAAARAVARLGGHVAKNLGEWAAHLLRLAHGARGRPGTGGAGWPGHRG